MAEQRRPKTVRKVCSNVRCKTRRKVTRTRLQRRRQHHKAGGSELAVAHKPGSIAKLGRGIVNLAQGAVAGLGKTPYLGVPFQWLSRTMMNGSLAYFANFEAFMQEGYFRNVFVLPNDIKHYHMFDENEIARVFVERYLNTDLKENREVKLGGLDALVEFYQYRRYLAGILDTFISSINDDHQKISFYKSAFDLYWGLKECLNQMRANMRIVVHTVKLDVDEDNRGYKETEVGRQEKDEPLLTVAKYLIDKRYCVWDWQREEEYSMVAQHMKSTHVYKGVLHVKHITTPLSWKVWAFLNSVTGIVKKQPLAGSKFYPSSKGTPPSMIMSPPSPLDLQQYHRVQDLLDKNKGNINKDHLIIIEGALWLYYQHDVSQMLSRVISEYFNPNTLDSQKEGLMSKMLSFLKGCPGESQQIWQEWAAQYEQKKNRRDQAYRSITPSLPPSLPQKKKTSTIVEALG